VWAPVIRFRADSPHPQVQKRERKKEGGEEGEVLAFITRLIRQPARKGGGREREKEGREEGKKKRSTPPLAPPPPPGRAMGAMKKEKERKKKKKRKGGERGEGKRENASSRKSLSIPMCSS